jgi:hypothetical protein
MRFTAACLLAPTWLCLALAPGLAFADGPIATAPAAQAQPAPAPVAPLHLTDADDGGDGSHVRMGPCGPQAIGADGKIDNRAHGFVEGGVGTSGYRHVAAGVCKPLANGGAVAVSVSDTQLQGRRYGP